jgi:hypothetical protein
MGWWTYLISPIGQRLAAVGAFFAGAFALYWRARRDGVKALRQEQQDEEMRRLRAAIEADARARERFARGELLQNDGHRRD